MAQADYISVARNLAQPTVEQTIRFAWFVAGAHSWYKHLPIDTKVPFVFFLDPNAGRSSINTPTGERAVVDITSETQPFHYTWQTTQAYRRRFGYWNYFAPYGSGFCFASDGGVLHTGQRLAQILDENGDWLSVTKAVHAAGTAEVNAFVHANLGRRGLEDSVALRQGLKTCVRKARQVLRKQRRAVVTRNRDAVESRLQEIFRTCDGVKYWLWNDWCLFDEDWEPHLRSKGASDRDVESALAILQWRLIEETGRPLDGDKMFDLMTEANLERHRQITEMWQAMRRVVEMVDGGRQQSGFLSRLFRQRWKVS